tara:strand:+ start:5107 stop:5721 length:615 start_codon:yes stop_codon:yes gene_type:complete
MTTIEKLTNLRDKIKVAFSEYDTPAPVVEEVEAADYVETTLESGEAVRAIPTLAVGSVMSLISPDGDIPAPDGSHTLVDGTQVVVLDGIISEVVESEIPEAESPDMVEMKSDMGTLKTENEKLKMSIQENAKAVDLKFAELEAKIANHNKINELLNEAFVALSEVPASTPSQPVKTETVQMSAQELIQAQTAKFEKLKLEKFKK